MNFDHLDLQNISCSIFAVRTYNSCGNCSYFVDLQFSFVNHSPELATEQLAHTYDVEGKHCPDFPSSASCALIHCQYEKYA